MAGIADAIDAAPSPPVRALHPASARRLAMGVAFGVVIGLLPKDSLLVVTACVLLMTTTASLVCAACAAAVFTCVGALVQPLVHRLGMMVLTANHLEGTWTWLSDLPVVPWTRFNNTIVMGSLIAGVLVAVPIYWISCRFFEAKGLVIHNRLRRNRFYRWLFAPAPALPAENAS